MQCPSHDVIPVCAASSAGQCLLVPIPKCRKIRNRDHNWAQRTQNILESMIHWELRSLYQQIPRVCICRATLFRKTMSTREFSVIWSVTFVTCELLNLQNSFLTSRSGMTTMNVLTILGTKYPFKTHPLAKYRTDSSS